MRPKGVPNITGPYEFLDQQPTWKKLCEMELKKLLCYQLAAVGQRILT